MDVSATSPMTLAQTAKRREDSALMDVAQKLEATFLSEMLKNAGLGKTPDSFGGGDGEDQFSSFLREAQAEKMVESGGIGLAQQIFESLKRTQDGAL